MNSSFVRSFGVLLALALVANVRSASATDATGWRGEFRNAELLGGEAVIQLSIEQQGSAIQVSFDAARNDGEGAATEGQGPGKVVGQTLQFSFTDNFKNSGTGVIKREGDNVSVSIKATRVSDPRAIVFYGENMRLKRVGKK